MPATAETIKTDPGEPSYYDLSLLQAPVWKWEIAWYFFLGGISGGAAVLGRLADRFGGRRYDDVARLASYVSLAGLVPCPPLLIADLGDPKRFHHMLRVFKPSTPMNLGTYLLTGHSGTCAIEAARQWSLARMTARRRRQFESSALNRILRLTSDVAGVPLALGLAGYTGVLLSCSSTPMWCRNDWIGPLFSSSAAATAASTVGLVMDVARIEGPQRQALDRIETAGHAAEAVSLAGYLKQAGPLAKPITQGNQKHHLWIAIAALLLGEVVKSLPWTTRRKRAAGILAAVISLIGGFSLRWMFVYGGHESGLDPRSARLSSKKPQVAHSSRV